MFEKLPAWIRNFFVDPTRDWVKAVHDPVLGELRLSGDASWWESSIECGVRSVEVHIAGTGGPDERLIAEAQKIIRSFPQFSKRISVYLEEATWTQFKSQSDEVRQLKIQELNFLWPDRPTYLEVYFSGPVEHRLWTCGYEDGVPLGLSFDT